MPSPGPATSKCEAGPLVLNEPESPLPARETCQPSASSTTPNPDSSSTVVDRSEREDSSQPSCSSPYPSSSSPCIQLPPETAYLLSSRGARSPPDLLEETPLSGWFQVHDHEAHETTIRETYGPLVPGDALVHTESCTTTSSMTLPKGSDDASSLWLVRNTVSIPESIADANEAHVPSAAAMLLSAKEIHTSSTFPGSQPQWLVNGRSKGGTTASQRHHCAGLNIDGVNSADGSLDATASPNADTGQEGREPDLLASLSVSSSDLEGLPIRGRTASNPSSADWSPNNMHLSTSTELSASLMFPSSPLSLQRSSPTSNSPLWQSYPSIPSPPEYNSSPPEGQVSGRHMPGEDKHSSTPTVQEFDKLVSLLRSQVIKAGTSEADRLLTGLKELSQKTERGSPAGYLGNSPAERAASERRSTDSSPRPMVVWAGEGGGGVFLGSSPKVGVGGISYGRERSRGYSTSSGHKQGSGEDDLRSWMDPGFGR